MYKDSTNSVHQVIDYYKLHDIYDLPRLERSRPAFKVQDFVYVSPEETMHSITGHRTSNTRYFSENVHLTSRMVIPPGLIEFPQALV